MQFNDPYFKRIYEHLQHEWDQIADQVYDGGYPHSHLILGLDDLIEGERERIVEDTSSSGSEPNFSEFNKLISYHNHRKSWLSYTINLRSDHVRWWDEFLNSHNNLIMSEASQSRKLVLITHGAALLGSMTALGAIEDSPYTSSFLAVAFGALVGFILAIVANIIWLESYGGIIAKLRSDFRPTRRMVRLRSYGKYLRRRWEREVRWSFFLTYASVASFPVYAALALALAFHA